MSRFYDVHAAARHIRATSKVPLRPGQEYTILAARRRQKKKPEKVAPRLPYADN